MKHIDSFKNYCKFNVKQAEEYLSDIIDTLSIEELLELEKTIDYTIDTPDITSLYKKDFETLITYNIQDVTLVFKLNNKFKFIELALSIMQLAKCKPESIFGTVQPWDCILYNELLKTKKLCPSVNRHDKQDFVGGYVQEIEPNFYKWLSVYDIVSSYPNQIISSNMSAETIIHDRELPDELRNIKQKFSSIETCLDVDSLEEIKPILEKYGVTFTSNRQFFRTDIDGFIASIYSKIFNKRLEAKTSIKKAKELNNKVLEDQATLLSYTLKILLNSGYGALANQHSRYFDIRIAEAITSDGQVCVRGCSEYVTNKLGIKVVASDTDSNFFNLEPIVKQRFGNNIPNDETVLKFLLKYNNKVLEPVINEFFDKLSSNLNMKRKTISMEPECIANSTIYVAKKRYIMSKLWEEGYTYESPKLKIKGVEIVRTSTPQWCRDKLKKAVNLIFETESNDILIDFINKCRIEFNTLPYETIAFPRGVQFSDYNLQSKSLPIAVRAAFIYNKFLKLKKLTDKYPLINNGDKIKFIFIEEPNVVGSNVIACSTKFPTEFSMLNVDYKTQFNKSFLAPLENIFTSIGWVYEKINSLDEFFS